MAQWKQAILAGTSPATASSAVIATATGLEGFPIIQIHALLVGATGGTLDVVLQSTCDPRAATQDETGSYPASLYGAAASWYDVLAFPQLAAGAGAVRYVSSLSRGYLLSAAITSVNTADDTPTLAANSVRPNSLGGALRLVATAGAGTTVGAAITVYLLCSEG